MTEKEEFNLGTLKREKKIHSSILFFFFDVWKEAFGSENDKNKFGRRRKKWKEKKELRIAKVRQVFLHKISLL